MFLKENIISLSVKERGFANTTISCEDNLTNHEGISLPVI